MASSMTKYTNRVNEPMFCGHSERSEESRLREILRSRGLPQDDSCCRILSGASNATHSCESEPSACAPIGLNDRGQPSQEITGGRPNRLARPAHTPDARVRPS